MEHFSPHTIHEPLFQPVKIWAWHAIELGFYAGLRLNVKYQLHSSELPDAWQRMISVLLHQSQCKLPFLPPSSPPKDLGLGSYYLVVSPPDLMWKESCVAFAFEVWARMTPAKLCRSGFSGNLFRRSSVSGSYRVHPTLQYF